MRRCAFLLIGWVGLQAAPYCDAPAEVRAELRRASALWDRPGSWQAYQADRKGIIEALLAKYPDDIQANRRYQNDLEIPKEELAAKYKARLDAKPDSAREMYFYGLALIGKSTPEAIRQFTAAIQQDGQLAWAHLALANIYSFGKFL